MIEFTIKTLDSVDHSFMVHDEITVRQLKDRVTVQLGVPIALQRLIFCGRVLQDEKKLAEYDVHGKVVHMVQRPPPGFDIPRYTQRPADNGNASNSAGTSNNPSLADIPLPTDLPSVQRRPVVQPDSDDDSDQPPPTPTPSPTTARMVFLKRILKDIRNSMNTLSRNGIVPGAPVSRSSENDMESEESSSSDSSPQRQTNRSSNSEQGPPAAFADLINELQSLESTFNGYRDHYLEILRESEEDVLHLQLSEEDIRRRQLTVDMSSELFHSFAHAYHLVSDITLDMSDGNARLTYRGPPRSSPLQARVNMLESIGRAVNANINTATSGNTGQPQAAAAAPQDDDVPPGLESLVRGLNEIARVGNLEVIVSLEEIAQGAGILGHIRRQGPNNAPATPGAGQPMFGSQIFLAQVPFTSPPTPEMVQNIVSSVVRQNIGPGMEGVVHAQVINTQANMPSRSQNSENRPNTGQGRNRPNGRPNANAQQSSAQPLHSRPQANLNNAQRNANSARHNQNNAQPSGSGTRQRPTRARADRRRPRTNCCNVVYDRFLSCDSHHARQTLTRRREEATQERATMNIREPCISQSQTRLNALFEQLDRAMHIGGEYMMIAAIVLMDDITNMPRARTLRSEGLITLRHRFGVYVYDLIQRSSYLGHEMELAQAIFRQHARFINRMVSRVEMRPEVDLVRSMRRAFARCLTEIVAVMNNPNTDLFLNTFRSFANRLFVEVCSLVAFCSTGGFASVRVMYEAFLDEIFANVPRPMQIVLNDMALTNLNACLEKIGVPGATETDRFICFLDDDEATISAPVHRINFPPPRPTESLPQPSTSTAEPESSDFLPYRSEAMSMSPPMTPEPFASMVTGLDDDDSDELYQEASQETTPATSQGASQETSPEQTPAASPAPRLPSAQAPPLPSAQVPPLPSAQAPPLPSALPPPLSSVQPPPLSSVQPPPLSSVQPPPLPSTPRPSAAAPLLPSTAASHLAFMQAPPLQFTQPPPLPYAQAPPLPPAAALPLPSAPALPMSFAHPPPPPFSQPPPLPFLHPPPLPASQAGTSHSSVTMSDSPRASRRPRSPSTSEYADRVIRVLVPPEDLRSHWGEDWVPTFTRDLHIQSAPGEPFSNAYLTGMPPTKRRCIRQTRPPVTFNEFVNDTVQEAARIGAGAPSHSFHATFREHMRNLIQVRASSSTDYNPQQHVATARFVNMQRITDNSGTTGTNPE